MSEEKKKRYYYYADKEKRAVEVRKEPKGEMVPYSFRVMQREFDRMMERIQREFEDFWEVPSRWSHGMRWRHRVPMVSSRDAMMPSTDLEDRGKDFHLTVDLPGFTKDELEIEVSDDSVTIHARRTQTEEEKKSNYLRRERASQAYYRRMRLPENIRSDDAKASLNNGILEITLPKKEPKETKKLTIT